MPNAAILLEEATCMLATTIDRLIPLLEPAMMVILGGLIAVAVGCTYRYSKRAFCNLPYC